VHLLSSARADVASSADVDLLLGSTHCCIRIVPGLNPSNRYRMDSSGDAA